MIRPAWAARAVAVALVAIAAAGCGGDDPDDPVVLALDSRPGPTHAGIYAAADRGLDAREGVRLRVRSPREPVEGLRLLDSGRADLAVVDIHELGRARDRGQDVVGVGAVVRRPMAALIARRDVHRTRDLEGGRVGISGLASELEMLKAIVRADGGDPYATRPRTLAFAGVPALAAGRVDAIVGAVPADLVALRRRGVPTRVFPLERGSAPYPELVLAAQRSTVEDDPRLIRRVAAAVRAGTAAAVADPAAAARAVHRRAGGGRALIRSQLRALRPALTPSPRLRAPDLRRWAELDARRGILERPPDVDRAFALGRTE